MSDLDQFYDVCKQGDDVAVLEYFQLHKYNLNHDSIIIYLSMGKNVELVKNMIDEMGYNTGKTKMEYHILESCLYNAVKSGDQNMIRFYINFWDTIYIKLHPKHEDRKGQLIEHAISGVINKLVFNGINADGTMDVKGVGVNFDIVNLFLEKECDPRDFFKLAVNMGNEELLKYIIEKYKDRNFLEEYIKNNPSDYSIKKATDLYNSTTNPSMLQKARRWVNFF